MTATRLAYTAVEKAEATSRAFEIGASKAAAQTGISPNTLRSWCQRRNSGLALNATPQTHERRLRSERPLSPPLPEGVSLVDESGRIRTPRSLYISVAEASGWWFADRSGITPALARKRGGYTWRHVKVAAFAIIERVNVGLDEPPYRECVAMVPGYGLDQQALVGEVAHESELPCIGPHGCSGHVEDIASKKKPLKASMATPASKAALDGPGAAPVATGGLAVARLNRSEPE
jgi:transposase-like protein